MQNKLDEYPSLSQAITRFEAEFTKSLPEGVFLLVKMNCFVHIAHCLEDMLLTPDEFPIERISALFNFLTDNLARTSEIASEFITRKLESTNPLLGADRTRNLFENAWTTYSDETYDHSVDLVIDRLEQSGFGAGSLQGKICFDGGCGTGRLSIALAKMGAAKVVAADFGAKSLSFFQNQMERYNLSSLEIVNVDVTDLSAYTSESFDFVASNGVLHHTARCLEGVDEHYRLVKPGGHLWLYLYGAGGVYWEIYDRVRSLLSDIAPELFRHLMMNMGVREGFVYTMIDNFFAPREYHYTSQIVERLSQQHPLTWRNQAGKSIFDDPAKYTATMYGKDILGAEGEIRLIVQKLNRAS